MKAQDNDLWVKTAVSMVEFLRQRHALSEAEVSVIQADLRFAYLLGHLDGSGDTAREYLKEKVQTP